MEPALSDPLGDSPNFFQAATGPEKLRGAYYTPPELVRLMLERVDPGPDDVVLDPSCGDGEFLVGALQVMAGHCPVGEPEGRALRLASCVVGLDVNPEAAALAADRVRETIHGLTGVRLPSDVIRVRSGDALDYPSRGSLLAALPCLRVLGGAGPGRLLVLGNPPYVEAKRLAAESRARLKRLYPRASAGAPDLYLYLLYVCLEWLRGEDRLAFVLPNKVLINTNGREIRERLLAQGRLHGIDFATRTGLFGKAAVYPVVLYAGAAGAQGQTTPSLATIERAGPMGERLERRELPALDLGVARSLGVRPLFPPPPTSSQRDALIRLVERTKEARLGDALEIRWTLSFHRRGLREQYVTRRRPDSPFARKILGGGAFTGNGEVRRYSSVWSGWWIDYDLARLRRDGNPLPAPELFARPQIAICQNGRTVRAALDEEEYALKDVFLCGRPRAGTLEQYPRALVGLLCSQAVHFFYSHVFFGGHVNGGYLHFLGSFLADVPLGRWEPALADEVEALVRERERAAPEQWERLEAEIEERVGSALGLCHADRAAIREWCTADPNWALRERVRAAKYCVEVVHAG